MYQVHLKSFAYDISQDGTPLNRLFSKSSGPPKDLTTKICKRPALFQFFLNRNDGENQHISLKDYQGEKEFKNCVWIHWSIKLNLVKCHINGINQSLLTHISHTVDNHSSAFKYKYIVKLMWIPSVLSQYPSQSRFNELRLALPVTSQSWTVVTHSYRFSMINWSVLIHKLKGKKLLTFPV